MVRRTKPSHWLICPGSGFYVNVVLGVPHESCHGHGSLVPAVQVWMEALVVAPPGVEYWYQPHRRWSGPWKLAGVDHVFISEV